MIKEWLIGIGGILGGFAAYLWFNDKTSGMNFILDCRDRIRLMKRSIDAWDAHWQENLPHSDVIISLTTLPSRLPYIEDTLKSLLYQRYAPHQIRLYIPKYSLRENCSYKLPAYLDHLQSLKIIRCDDYGPATKYIPALRQCPPGQKILVVDDDRIYPPSLVGNFCRWSEENPHIAIGAAGWIVPSDLTDRELTFWRNLWQIPPAPIKSTRISQERRVHILEGYAGYLIKPEFFELVDLSDYENAPSSAFYVDDVWMSAHCRVPRYVFPADRHVFNHWRTKVFDRTALWQINNGDGDPEKRNNTIMIRFFQQQWEPLEKEAKPLEI